MITLICGHPRAGKTTYSRRFSCPVIHLDDNYSTANVLKKIKGITDDVVVEGIYYRPQQRRELLSAYKGGGSLCICLDTPKETREERLGYKLKHDYPFLIPTYDEGWDEIIIIRGNDEQRINRQRKD